MVCDRSFSAFNFELPFRKAYCLDFSTSNICQKLSSFLSNFFRKFYSTMIVKRLDGSFWGLHVTCFEKRFYFGNFWMLGRYPIWMQLINITARKSDITGPAVGGKLLLRPSRRNEKLWFLISQLSYELRFQPLDKKKAVSIDMGLIASSKTEQFEHEAKLLPMFAKYSLRLSKSFYHRACMIFSTCNVLLNNFEETVYVFLSSTAQGSFFHLHALNVDWFCSIIYVVSSTFGIFFPFGCSEFLQTIFGVF